MRTTRQRLADRLRSDPATPSELSSELGIPVAAVLAELEHVAQSLQGTGETVAVRAPRCRACDFDQYDDLLNVPSRCPKCRSERIDEPVLRVE